MKVIRARNVHEALPEALYQLRTGGFPGKSRNGPVIAFPEPVTTVYERPAERVVFWKERDANPFFHLFESLWMLGGRNDVESVARFVGQMRSYSDDGVSFHGAYGYRWRHHFGFDQLQSIIEALRNDKDDRRQVLSMWDTTVDLGRQGKDLPCNLQAIFRIDWNGRLDMTVTNRSNDLIWGAYGANAVHFSYLHEYMSRCIGVEQGVYRQVSTNLHVYTDKLGQVLSLADVADSPLQPWAHRHVGLDPYRDGLVEPYPLMSTPPDEWAKDLDMFLTNPKTIGIRDPFFRRVAAPMLQAHSAFKVTTDPSRFNKALGFLERVEATDWKKACVEWIERRRASAEERTARAKDDGVDYE